mgnify:CR=1 FL=1
MKLNKNAFPVKITLEEAVSIVQKEFNRKGHKVNITKNNFHLNIVPFWVCFYDVDSKKNNVYKHYTGQVALNSLTNRSQEEYLKLLEHETPQNIDTIDIALEKIEIRLKKSLLTKAEAQDIIAKMLSCKFEVDKDNLTLSGFEEMYIPIWKCNFENHELSLDAVLGKINNFNIINQKTKDNKDLFIEMLDEIKDPKKFLEYVFEFFKNIFLFIFRNWKSFFIVLLILLIVYFVFF